MMPPRSPLAPIPPESEAQFQEAVLDAAARLGWELRYHTWRSDHSPAGFPDLVLCRGDRLLFAELKSESGRVSKAQQDWLDGLAEVRHLNAYVWRPSQLEEIVRIIR